MKYYLIDRETNKIKIWVYDIIALIGISMLVIWKLWPLISESITIVSTTGDVGEMTYPIIASAARSLNEGSFPFWMRELFAGQTLLGFPRTGSFYPLNWLIWLLGYTPGYLSFRIVDWMVILHVFIAAYGMYFLSRVLKLNRGISFLLSIFYTISPAALSWLYWHDTFTSIVWFPTIMGFMILALRQPNRYSYRYVALGSLAVGLSVLALPGVTAVKILYTTGFFFIYDLVRNIKDKSYIINSTIKAALFFGIGLLITLPPLLSISVFFDSSLRFTAEGAVLTTEGITYTEFVSRTFSRMDLLRFIVGEPTVSRIGYTRDLLNNGTLPAILCIVAFFLPKKKHFGYFKILFVIVSLTLIGMITPFFLYRLPMMNYIRYLWFFRYVFNFASVLLAGLTLQWIYDKFNPTLSTVSNNISYEISNSKQSALRNKFPTLSEFSVLRISVPIFGIILISIYSWNISNSRFNHLLASLIFLTLIVLIILFIKNRKILKYISWACIPIVCILFIYNVDDISFRFGNDSETVKNHFNSSREIAEFFTPSSPEETFRIHTTYDDYAAFGQGNAAIFGFNSSFGYSNPVLVASLNNFWFLPLNVYSDLLNIRYFASTVEDIHDYWRVPEDTSDFIYIGTFDNILNRYGEYKTVHVYEKINRPGHAWFVDDFIYYRDYSEGLGHLINSTFDLRDTALMHYSFVAPTKNEILLDAHAIITHYDTNMIIINVQTNKEALLVVSEYYYPGWRARINGRTVQIHNANVYLRGIVVPEGTHVIEMRYFPDTLIIGLIGLSTAIIAIALLILYSYGVIFRNKDFTIVLRGKSK